MMYTADEIDVMCGKVEVMLPTKYIPSVEELKYHKVEDYLEEYMPYLLYLSESISKLSEEEKSENPEKYKAVHKYVCSMIDKFNEDNEDN